MEDFSQEFSQLLSERAFKAPFHRVFFSGCRSLDWQIFSFSTLKMLLYCFLASIISVTSAIQLVSVKRMYCLAAFCI